MRNSAEQGPEHAEQFRDVFRRLFRSQQRFAIEDASKRNNGTARNKKTPHTPLRAGGPKAAAREQERNYFWTRSAVPRQAVPGRIAIAVVAELKVYGF